jgi:D-xylose 1-dehydrogenase (NADP+, D-xylono-1,5-lactone-forming)
MSNPRVLRWGLLSTAAINSAVIGPIRAAARNTLVAVASRDAAKGAAYAKHWEIDTHFASYEALLASADIDAVYISLPNSMHAEWSIKAARAGKHVLCEKPLATTVADAEAIAQAARDNAVVIAEAFMYRHHPQTLHVQELVQSGAIGEVQLVRGSFSYQIAAAEDVRLNPALGGGSLWDVGCYPISYARTIIGSEPAQAYAVQHIGAASGVEETCSGQLRFANGAVAQIDSSFRMPWRTHLEIVGSAGMIVLPSPFKMESDWAIHIGTGYDALEKISVSGSRGLYSGQIDDMAAAVLNGSPQRISLADSIANTRAILALYRSAASGQAVAV